MSIRQISTEEAAVRRPPFQFSIRTLLLAVAVAGGLFAVMAAVGTLWSVVLCWFLLLAAAHVAGNAQGTRHRHSCVPPLSDSEVLPARLATHRNPKPVCAPTTSLGQKRPLNRPLLLGAISAIFGAMTAAGFLTLLHLGRVGLWGVVVGAMSAAVLCGLFGYLSTSLLEVTMHAFGEARRGSGNAR